MGRDKMGPGIGGGGRGSRQGTARLARNAHGANPNERVTVETRVPVPWHVCLRVCLITRMRVNRVASENHVSEL